MNNQYALIENVILYISLISLNLDVNEEFIFFGLCIICLCVKWLLMSLDVKITVFKCSTVN